MRKTRFNLKSKNLIFTKHALRKMSFYRVSFGRVSNILHSPKRVEEGIVPGTIAMMQRAGSRKHTYEVWIMVARIKRKLNLKNHHLKLKSKIVPQKQVTKVISAWKYPGITQPGEQLPEEILREFRNVLF